jgi:hypothetical protein
MRNPLHIIKFESAETLHHIIPDISSSASLVKANSSLASPCVWIVNQEDLAKLRVCSDVVDDKGAKHPAIQLARTMLRGEKIPLIDGGYSSVGKLRDGVKKLLQKASDTSYRLMIIGAANEIFAELLRLAEAEPVSYMNPFPPDGKVSLILPGAYSGAG